MSGCSTISDGEIGPFSRASAERASMASRHACRRARHACRLLSFAFPVAVAVAVALSPRGVRCAATPLSSAIDSGTPLSGPPRALSGPTPPASSSASSHVPVSLLT